MVALLQVCLLFTLFSSLLFYRLNPCWWVPFAFTFLLVATLFSSISWWLLSPIWAVLIALSVLAFNTSIRKIILTQPALRFLRQTMPSISKTEQIALDAGEVLWEAELFCGAPQWQNLFGLGKPQLTEEEQHFLDNEVETLCDMLNDWDMFNELNDLPKEAWAYIKANRFWGLEIPKEYGGLGFSGLMHSAVITRLCSRSTSAAVTVMVPNSLGPAELLHYYGTEQQKNEYLPRLAAGIDIPCFALTSPTAGSDATSLTDSGVVCRGLYKGQSIIGIKLNWDKRYITLAPVATLIGLAFRLSDPEKLLGQEEDIGITLCLIPANHPGVEIGERHCPMYAAFMNGPTRGHDVFIPLDWIIGGQERAGQGWQMLMECLSIGRSISLPAIATSTTGVAYRSSSAYARIREQFDMPIGQFEGIADALGRIGGGLYLIEANRLLAAQYVSLGHKPTVISAMAKYHMTELGRSLLNDAMDIHAGRGIQLGPRNYLGLGYLAYPIAITVEGANIMTRNLMIFGQGALRCHPYLREEIVSAARNDAEGEEQFDKLIFSHIGYTLRNAVATLAYGLSGGRLIRSPRAGDVAKYYRQITRMSAALAFVSDVTLLTLGGKLKRRESLSARLGDVLSHLYLGTAVLKYYDENQKDDFEIAYVDYALQYCLSQIQIAFDEFFTNFSPWLGRLLRRIVFPFGRNYRAPRDKNRHQIANHMMKNTPLRDRLTTLTYIGKQAKAPLNRLENAWLELLSQEPVRARIQQAVKLGVIPKSLSMERRIDVAIEEEVITSMEGKNLRHCYQLVQDALAVDDFPHDSFASNQQVKSKMKSA